MSKMNASGDISARAAQIAHVRSAAAFDKRTADAPRALPADIGRHRPVGGQVKRAIDIALALIALVLFAPMFLLVAVLLRVVLGRPILVAEHYIGFAGQVFTAYTFRTSPVYRAREPANHPTIATCVASFRESGLDCLPQLLNILRGDMSFVGPRPVTVEEFGRRGHCAPDYFAARPGLVSLCRPDRSGKFGYKRRLALERYYVRRWSVSLDLALLANAAVAVRHLSN